MVLSERDICAIVITGEPSYASADVLLPYQIKHRQMLDTIFFEWEAFKDTPERAKSSLYSDFLEMVFRLKKHPIKVYSELPLTVKVDMLML